MLRRAAFLVAFTGLLTTLPAVSAGAATRGVACSLAGSATFSPGLTASLSTSTSYTFSGSLTNCESTDSTLTSGTVTASGSATGSGLSCGGGTSAGTGTITWNNGTSTAISFTTSGAGPLVAVQTKATSSSEPAVAAGDSGGGSLAFQTTTPQDCAGSGLTSATFNGEVASGSPT